MPDSDRRKTFNLNFSFGQTSPLPADALPAELLERLRAGGTLTDADLATLHAAAVQDGSNSKLLGVLMASGALDAPTQTTEPTTVVSDDGTTVIASGPTKVFEWRLGGGAGADEQAPVRKPATYYEALSGRPDPDREFFVNARRTLNLIVTGLAIGLPVGLTLLAIAVGESLETIIFVAIGASIVGVMIKSTFPRTPFG